MTKRRMIHSEIWQSESIARLTIRQRLLFIGMFSNADDQGRLRASAPAIRSMVYPYDDFTIQELEEDILAIEREQCIILYVPNGSRIAQVINWWKYQNLQWAYPSSLPKPDGWIDRLRYRHSGKVITENWKAPEDQISIDQNSIVQNRAGKDLPKDLPKENGKRTSKESTPKEWMDALYKLCGVDISLASSGMRKRISETGKALIASGAKLEDVERFGIWWSSDEWRSKNTPTPTPEKVRDNWSKMNGNGTYKAEPQQKPRKVYQ